MTNSKICGPKRREVQIRNCRFNIIMEKDIEFFDSYWNALENGDEEPSTFQVIEEKVTKKTTVLELGAWIGTMALYEACLAKQVYAFEADPVALESLKNNIAENPEIKNIQAIEKLVSNEEGIHYFYSEHSGNNSASSVFKVDGKSSWKVEAVNLDSFVAEKEISGPIFLNVDIEGAEYSVFPPLKKIFKCKNIQMCLSLHPHLIANTVRGNTLMSKLIRRLKLLWLNYRVLRVRRHFSRMLDANLMPTSKYFVLWELLVRGKLDSDKKELFFLN